MPFKLLRLVWLLAVFGVCGAAAQNCETKTGLTGDKKENKLVQVEYDSSAGETLVQVPLTVVPPADFSLRAEKVVIKAGFVYKGKKLTEAPKSVLLELFTNARGDGLFADEQARRLSVKVDDKLLLFGIFRLFSSRPGVFMNQMNKWRMEHVGIEVPLEAFVKLVGGEKVVLEVGGEKIKLKSENLKSFCKLLSYARVAGEL